MGTRAYIGMVNSNGSVTAVYNHQDGYISWAGLYLSMYYSDRKKVKKLLSNGDIYSLRSKITPNKNSEHKMPCKYNGFMNKRQANVCLFFNRDGTNLFNNKNNTKPKHFDNIDDYINKMKEEFDIEYVYLYNRETWFVLNNGKFENILNLINKIPIQK